MYFPMRSLISCCILHAVCILNLRHDYKNNFNNFFRVCAYVFKHIYLRISRICNYPTLSSRRNNAL